MPRLLNHSSCYITDVPLRSHILAQPDDVIELTRIQGHENPALVRICQNILGRDRIMSSESVISLFGPSQNRLEILVLFYFGDRNRDCPTDIRIIWLACNRSKTVPFELGKT